MPNEPLGRHVKLLSRYVDHLRGCRSYTNGPCTCGFEKAMRELDHSPSVREAAREAAEQWFRVAQNRDFNDDAGMITTLAAIIERHCSPVSAAGGDEDNRPSYWHCGVVLESTELKLRCDQCSADCDDETCGAFGCAPRLATAREADSAGEDRK